MALHVSETSKLLKIVKKALLGTSKILLLHYTQRMIISVLHPGKIIGFLEVKGNWTSSLQLVSGYQKLHKANRIPIRYVVNLISVPTFGRKSLSKMSVTIPAYVEMPDFGQHPIMPGSVFR